jgi:hypothetical protein
VLENAIFFLIKTPQGRCFLLRTVLRKHTLTTPPNEEDCLRILVESLATIKRLLKSEQLALHLGRLASPVIACAPS